MGDQVNLDLLNGRTVMMGMACLLVLICAVILLFRKTERRACLFLSAFFIAAILSVGPQIIGYAGFYDRWPNLTYFPLFSTELWLAPLVYLHADRLMRGVPLGWRKLLFLPGIVQTLYYTVIFFRWDNHLDKWAYNGKVHAPYVMPVENTLTIISMILAVVAIGLMVRTYKQYLENTSSAARDYDPVWLRNMFMALLIAGSIFACLELADTVIDLTYNMAFPFQVLTILLIGWIAIEAVWRLTKDFPKMESAQLVDSPERKDGRNWKEDAVKLKEKVLQEQWYLEPRLSIRDIAARMGTNESYISRALNQGQGESFNRFINGMRIDHAKDLMAENRGSILNIAYDSGFNSKATFNRVFKDISGQTPSAYKKSQNP